MVVEMHDHRKTMTRGEGKPMEIVKARMGGVPLLQVVGDLDHETSPMLLAAAEETLDPKTAHILLDLEACHYVDSGGLRVLVQILKNVKSRLGWLGVIAPTKDVQRLLERVALIGDPSFRVFPNRAGAAKQLEAEALRN